MQRRNPHPTVYQPTHRAPDYPGSAPLRHLAPLARHVAAGSLALSLAPLALPAAHAMTPPDDISWSPTSATGGQTEGTPAAPGGSSGDASSSPGGARAADASGPADGAPPGSERNEPDPVPGGTSTGAAPTGDQDTQAPPDDLLVVTPPADAEPSDPSSSAPAGSTTPSQPTGTTEAAAGAADAVSADRAGSGQGAGSARSTGTTRASDVAARPAGTQRGARGKHVLRPPYAAGARTDLPWMAERGWYHETGPSRWSAAPSIAPATPSAASPQATTSSAQPDSWTVQPGDTLWDITATLLSTAVPGTVPDTVIARAWPRLYGENVAVIGADPSLIRPGQHLTVPADLVAVLDEGQARS